MALTSNPTNDLDLADRTSTMWTEARQNWDRNPSARVLTITATQVIDPWGSAPDTDTSRLGVLLCNNTTSATITLPLASTNSGRIITVKKINSGAVTIDGNGTETIDGALTKSLAALYDALRLICDGSNWHII